MASSPVRRVLGDKDTNTSLNVRSSKAAVNAQSTSVISPIPKATVHSISPQIGQKRKLEDAEETNHSSQQSDNGSDGVGFDALQSSSIYYSNDTQNTSFTASQGAENLLEPQFELPQEEMSQKTLDKLHDVPMPQDDQESPLSRPSLSHDVSLGSMGMSSFINFEDNSSSQGSDGMHVIEQGEEVVRGEDETHKVCCASASVKEDERKKMLEEKTSQLRTRLQLALFKVQTNQTSRPFKRLKPPISKRGGSSSPPVYRQRPLDARPSPQPHLPGLPASQRPVDQTPSQMLSPESRISSFRARATAQLKPTIPSLASLPVPRIQPTAYSSRWTTAPASSVSQEKDNKEEQRDEMDDVQLPSSPPLSRVPSVPEDHAHSDPVEEIVGVQKTPKTPAVAKSIADIQLSSPPASEIGQDETNLDRNSVGTRQQQKPKRRNEVRSLTSSVVKGEAADGLLQLMRGSEGLC